MDLSEEILPFDTLILHFSAGAPPLDPARGGRSPPFEPLHCGGGPGAQPPPTTHPSAGSTRVIISYPVPTPAGGDDLMMRRCSSDFLSLLLSMICFLCARANAPHPPAPHWVDAHAWLVRVRQRSCCSSKPFRPLALSSSMPLLPTYAVYT